MTVLGRRVMNPVIRLFGVAVADAQRLPPPESKSPEHGPLNVRLCKTGENEQAFRRESYTQNG